LNPELENLDQYIQIKLLFQEEIRNINTDLGCHKIPEVVFIKKNQIKCLNNTRIFKHFKERKFFYVSQKNPSLRLSVFTGI
jgi:hypothetical protein